MYPPEAAWAPAYALSDTERFWGMLVDMAFVLALVVVVYDVLLAGEMLLLEDMLRTGDLPGRAVGVSVGVSVAGRVPG